jgi:outer membrane protein assembly factor BamD (BamD/ComL family)
MRRRLQFLMIVGGLLCGAAWQPLAAQYGFDLEIKKPEPYDNRTLRAEKTGEKKLKMPKKFFQNLYTHYNYYFNANNKLNEVLYLAKQQHRDDYTTLLPFYNYSFDATAGNTQLDTVISKARTGIVMHDLRNDWIDNLYMLWGGAYFFQKKFDSASLMFQFINYSFAEKEADGYYRYIGSRMDGGDANSIATKEKTGLVQKVFSTSPSRNDAFIWQVRSMIEMDNLTDAGTLIAMLKNDANFPARLHDDLEEVQAYWFYRQGIWDSSAVHLVKALDQAQGKGELARWEYLAAQMFERSKNRDEAFKWYSKAQGHSIDPVMDVFARLNQVRLNKDGGENYIDKNIADLVKMAKREKFSEYSETIYYMAAQMELERGNLAAAQDLLQRAVKKSSGDAAARSRTFLQIADLSFDQKKYVPAAYFYDSVQTNTLKPEEATRVDTRKPPLGRVAYYSSILSRQDSLHRIAALPEDERKSYINKLVKQLRKQQGLAEEGNTLTGGRTPLPGEKAPDLFASQTKGEWYFYNDNLRRTGEQQFKQVWGNRPNTDNWRRISDVSRQMMAKSAAQNGNINDNRGTNGQAADAVDNTPTYASLLAKLPLTPEAIQLSNDSIMNALFSLGSVYIRELEDYPSAIEVFEKLRGQFGHFNNMDEVLFQLYFAYTKTGDAVKAALMKEKLKEKFPSSRFTAIAFTGKDPSQNTEKKQAATKSYEGVYDLFIEGRFEEALAAKRIADSVHKTTVWQPQLLYIQAVYHIKNREDSLAKISLNTLISQGPDAPMAKKAQTMLDVLSRRQQIEDELNHLQIDRPLDTDQRNNTIVTAPKPEINTPVPSAPKPIEAPQIRQEEDPKLSGERQRDLGISGRTNGVSTRPNLPGSADTTGGRKMQFAQPKKLSAYTFDVAQQHYAVVVLNKVDQIFSNESKNAFARFSRERFYTQNPGLSVAELDSSNKLLLIGPFNNAQEAIDYTMQAKKLAASEIIPWLKPERYSFLIIAPNNLELLQEKKDLLKYKAFLEANVPGKF